jgi:hypothetical protein
VPAMDIDGIGRFGVDVDFFIAAGPVGGENWARLVEGASRRW